MKEIISIDMDKCFQPTYNCLVKTCKITDELNINIDRNQCIGCRSCINSCKTGTRYYEDDLVEFVKSDNKMIGIVSPSVTKVFKNRDHLRINGWLKKNGCVKVFDVSFGMKIVTKAYTKFVKDKIQILLYSSHVLILLIILKGIIHIY